MKKPIILSSLSLITLLAISSSYANIEAQKNCTIDPTISKNTSSASTTCTWFPKKDKDMQIALKVDKDVEFIAGSCVFMPTSSDSTDKIKEIKVSKSGNKNGSARPSSLPESYQIVDGNNIKVILRNFNTVFDEKDKASQLNVLFYSNSNYTGGNQITCTFSPLSMPSL